MIIVLLIIDFVIIVLVIPYASAPWSKVTPSEIYVRQPDVHPSVPPQGVEVLVDGRFGQHIRRFSSQDQFRKDSHRGDGQNTTPTGFASGAMVVRQQTPGCLIQQHHDRRRLAEMFEF